MVRKLPMSPRSIIAFTSMKFFSKRIEWSITSLAPARSQAAIMRSASSRSKAIGFSQRMPRAPASAAAIVAGPCRLSSVTTLTMSRSASVSISSYVL